MTGEMGVLYQNDQQVGGLYNWAIDLITLPSGEDSGWRQYSIKKQITAAQYWLIKATNGNIFEARFLKYNKEDFLTLDRGMVEIDLPDKTLDKTIRKPLEIRWIR